MGMKFLSLDYFNVNILIVILCYSFARLPSDKTG